MASAQTDHGFAVGGDSAGILRRRGWVRMLERIVLGAMTMVLTFNVWTGVPLLALWVGSRFAFGDNLSMGAIVIALLCLGGLMLICLHALSWLSGRYDRVTGRPPAPRQPAPWLLSMRAEAARPARPGREVNAVETIVVMTVVVAVITFEVWFFFLAKASLPQ